VKQLLDANIPNYELQHVYTVKKNTGLFQNQKKLEREGRIIVFCFPLRFRHKFPTCQMSKMFCLH